MSTRSRRTVQPRGGAGVASALAQLNAAKGGAKRVETFELREETAVYDVVDDEQYAQLVTKRRIEAGDFIEEDDGEYAADMGEDEDFFSGDAAAGKKRKDGAGKDSSAAKRQAAEEAAAKRRNKERMHAMFARAAAQSAAAAPGKADNTDADALLEDILGDLDPGTAPKPSPVPAAAAAAAAGRGAVGTAVGPKPVPRPVPARAATAAAAAAGSSGGGGAKTFSRGSSRPSAAPAAAAPRRGPQQQQAVAAQQPAQSFSFGGAACVGGGGGGGDEAAPADDGCWGAGGEDDGAAGPDVAMQDAELQQEQQQQQDSGFAFAPPGEPAEVSGDPFASPAPAQRQPAPAEAAAPPAAAAAPAGASHKRFADDVPSGPDVRASPATGWCEVYGADPAAAGGDAGGEAGAEPAAAAAAEGAGCVDGVVTEESGDVAFYFMDAYEAPERSDVLYLFGKVAATNSSSGTAGGSSGSGSSPGPSPSAGGAASPGPSNAGGSGGGSGSGGSSSGGPATWQSCCVVVPNLHRSLLVVPRPSVFEDSSGEIAALEAAVAEDPARRMELLTLLHARCKLLKDEVRSLMLRHGVRTMRVVPVKRSYAFEDPAIPSREQWVLKVRYPASLPALPLGVSGEHFSAIAGTNQSMLEALLVKRGLRGPGWATLRGARRRSGTTMVSWCRVELELPSPKGVTPAAPGSPLASRPCPPLTVAALSLRLHIDPKSQTQEVLAASVVHLSGVSAEAPTPRSLWGSPAALRNFSIVRKLDGRPWPTGFEALVASENASPRGRLNGGAMLATAANERALLSCLVARLAALDADVLLGHNIGAYELSVLLGRLQAHKVQLWSRIGRLRRSTFPKLAGGGHTFGGGASPGLMACLAGRLLCDTYLSARELVREVDYTLKTLAKNLLGQERTEVPSNEVPARYDSAAGLRQLLLLGESDAWLALGLAMQLSVLPLTRQLSSVSGSLWGRTLQGARAQRIEMLLLHEFHARKFILPDKLTMRDRAALAGGTGGAAGAKAGRKATKRGGGGGDEEADGPPLPDEEEEEQQQGGGAAGAAGTAGASRRAGGKGPQYAGGLVLEPKKGLYDKFVIMLDFNSLYPSIIQEYNICFTTVKRPADGAMAALPAAPSGGSGGGSSGLAPLPTVIQGLVRRRREVKAQMKNCRDPVLLQQLTIRQQALKLTANSMYGCLGFSNSRFFARPLAELITSQGRDILQATVDLVAELGVPGLEVIYGDTDSIMVHTNSSDYDAAEALGARIKAAVNRRYRLLEIELDAVYRSMLLLKKKKYAAIKVERGGGGSSGALSEALEAKGLDMVRRDWCPLSKDTGNYALQQILSGKPKAEVVEAVHERLRSVAAQLSGGQLPLGSFVITKQLTKRPDDYPDARGQPHVQVALRRRAAGKRDGVMAGETVPYVICLRLSKEEAEAAAAPPVSAAAAAGSGDQQQPQQAAEAAPASPGAAPAAAAGQGQPDAAQQQQQQPDAPPQQAAGAGAAPRGNGVRAASASKAASGSGGGGIADRAFHPDELRSDPSLVIDADYYLAQQVLPVVTRLCAPIEGTNASHLAQCLGLDPSRYGHSSAGSGGAGMAAALREEALQVCGSLLDSDAHYASCEGLSLTSPNGTTWDFGGVRAAIKAATPGSCLLTPPDAVGDPAAELSAAQLANQALLAARRAIVRYYDGRLVSDDEMAAAGDARDVVLAPPPPDAPPGCLPLPAAPGGARGGGGGALLSRAFGEAQLYAQLSHLVRLLDVNAALATLPDKQRRAAALAQLAGGAGAGAGGGSPAAVAALKHAAGLVGRLRDASGYRWIDLGALLGRLRAGHGRGGAGGAQARP